MISIHPDIAHVLYLLAETKYMPLQHFFIKSTLHWCHATLFFFLVLIYIVWY